MKQFDIENFMKKEYAKNGRRIISSRHHGSRLYATLLRFLVISLCVLMIVADGFAFFLLYKSRYSTAEYHNPFKN